MLKAGIDQDALIKVFSDATTRQGEALRDTVRNVTLQALQQRELTMGNIKKVLQSVTAATATGAAKNAAAPADVEAMLTSALSGMDGALLQAVEANRKALEHFVKQGAAQEKQFKGALANIEKMEETFFATVTKAAHDAGAGNVQRLWEHALGTMRSKGSDTGTQATQAVEQLMAQAQESLKQGRATTVKTAQAMLDGYTALVSGVLIGMSEGMQQGGAKPQKH